VIGTFSFNFSTVLPLLAKFTFHGTATTLALLTGALAVGSIIGALTTGARQHLDPRFLVSSAFAFGALTAAAALTPTFALMLVALAATGMASVSFSAGTNSLTQLAADPEMRGRVMALYGIVFLGSTPIGAPIAGWVSSVLDPRAGLALGAAAALLTALIAWGAAVRDAPREAATSPARA
jgi:MFS family permease